jgi:hypothetical protein
VSRICSPTSCERNSYETLLRPGGSISICSRRIRILHIAMNEHGLSRRAICQSMQRARRKKEIKAVEIAPVVVLRDDVVCAGYSRWRGKLDWLEIPNLLVRGLESTSELPRVLLRTRRACLVSAMLICACACACATWLSACLRLLSPRPRLGLGLRLRSRLRLRLG